MKRWIKRILLRRKNIWLDKKSNLNYGVEHFLHTRGSGKKNLIVDCQIKLDKIGDGCFLEHVYGYGNIELGSYVSISGPGTILHSEIGKIKIGSFSSIAENVSIQEFNHNMNRITSAAIGYQVFGTEIEKDMVTKGDIVIEEDVWIGSNAVILSGVTVGRGSVIGAGTVVTKNVPPYSIVLGNPGRVVKKRFTDEIIAFLEKLNWWTWDEDKIKRNQELFEQDLTAVAIDELDRIIK